MIMDTEANERMPMTAGGRADAGWPPAPLDAGSMIAGGLMGAGVPAEGEAGGGAMWPAATTPAALALAAGIREVGFTGDPRIDAMIWGIAWSAPGPSYSFPASPAAYENPYGNFNEPRQPGFAPVSAGQARTLHSIIEGVVTSGSNAVTAYGSVESLTGLDLAYLGTSGAAELRFADTGYSVAPAWTYAPVSGGAFAGDAWFSTGYYRYLSPTRPMLGDYFHHMHLHEVAHTLGLKEASLTNNGRGPVPAEWDSLEFAVTSYRSYPGAAFGYTNEAGGFPQSYMMLDIAALQTLYGADFGTQAGDTTYRWNATTGEMSVNGVAQGAPVANRVFLTIWDGGGNDTYDLSNYSGGVSVDLQPGGWSVISAPQLALLGAGRLARGNVFNALTYQGDLRSLIENAIGGAGNDVLSGNAGGNALSGLAGNDTLSGLGGDDWLQGGAGADRVLLRGGRGDYAIGPGAAPGWTQIRDAVPGRDGTDQIADVEALVFTNPAVWRFYNTRTGVHFFTASEAERDYVINSFPQFHYEELGLRALSNPDEAGATPIFRFYNVITQAHFFTASAAERDYVLNTFPQFQFEGVAFHENAAGGPEYAPVFRFYNVSTQAHFYTPSADERDWIIATLAEWQAEGIAYHAPIGTTDLMPIG